MPKNRKSSAHNYKMQAKNEVLINYRQEHIKAYNRNQKFTRHILLYSLLSMIYFPILCVLMWQKRSKFVLSVAEIAFTLFFCDINSQ